jgi:hypothetical protein
MKRMDRYPHDTSTRGGKVSPWFRLGLIDTYEKGFMAGLGWHGLATDAQTGELRYADESRGEKAEINLMVTGYIPYENVESVDWDGDKYYDYPHVYCYFDFNGEPYERVGFCEKRELDGHEYFTELADYKAVRKLSRRRGINR